MMYENILISTASYILILILILYIQKKLRRIKFAKDLYKSKDERIIKYEKRPLLKILADRLYHSPEISETDDESDKTKIYVYDYSWRSNEV